MVQLNFNATQYDPSTGSADVLETGVYAVQITNSEVKPTKANNGYMLVFTLTCLDAAVVGRKITARLNIHNQNPQAVEIAYRELSAISHVVGVIHWQDTQQLHGRPFKVSVEKTERNDKPGSLGNEIKAYMDYTGNPPNPAGGGAGNSLPPSAPTAPQMAPAAGPGQGFAPAPQPAVNQQPSPAMGTGYAPAPAPAAAPVQGYAPQDAQAAPAPWQGQQAPAPQQQQAPQQAAPAPWQGQPAPAPQQQPPQQQAAPAPWQQATAQQAAPAGNTPPWQT